MVRMNIMLCGAGALGSWIGLFLAGPERNFYIIDDDVVKEHNVEASAYGMRHVGNKKAAALGELIYAKAFCLVQPKFKTLKKQVDAGGYDLVIDTFDNVESRALTIGLSVPTIHVGLSADRTGAVLWDDIYVLPESEFKRGENPVCTHHLGKQLVRYTSLVASTIIEQYLEEGDKGNCIIHAETFRIIGI